VGIVEGGGKGAIGFVLVAELDKEFADGGMSEGGG